MSESLEELKRAAFDQLDFVIKANSYCIKLFEEYRAMLEVQDDDDLCFISETHGWLMIAYSRLLQMRIQSQALGLISWKEEGNEN